MDCVQFQMLKHISILKRSSSGLMQIYTELSFYIWNAYYNIYYKFICASSAAPFNIEDLPFSTQQVKFIQA